MTLTEQYIFSTQHSFVETGDYKHYKRTEQNDLTSLTDPNRPITTDLRHLSLTASNIKAISL